MNGYTIRHVNQSSSVELHRLINVFNNYVTPSKIHSFRGGTELKNKSDITYRDIEKILLDFNQDLRNELHNSNPDFIKDLQRRREDIEKTENCILIAGIA